LDTIALRESLETTFLVRENTFRDEWQTKYLTFDKYSNTFIYTHEPTTHIPLQVQPNFDETRLLETSQEFLSLIGYQPALLSFSEIEYLVQQTGVHLEETVKEEATHARLVFEFQNYSNSAVLDTNLANRLPAIEIVINGRYIVTRSQIKNRLLEPVSEITVASLSLEESIQQNNAAFLNTFVDDQGNPLDINDYRNLSIEETTLKYYLDSETGTVYPMYDSIGILSNNQTNQTVSLQIPAFLETSN
jgi:hypothetical protein